MLTAAERRAKIEKLKSTRELKEKERREREESMKQEAERETSSNEVIARILSQNQEAQEQLMTTQTIARTGQVEQAAAKDNRLPLRVDTFVVELEIQGIPKPERYDKETSCDIPDPRARLGRIAEDDELDDF